MDDKLKKLLNENSTKFSEWVDKLNAYNQSFLSESKTTDEENLKLYYGAAGVLGELSELFFKFGAFKDKFYNSKMHINFDGPSLIINSQKTGNTFNFAIGSKGIYLKTCLRFAENLRYMDDSFYSDILSLENLGKFELVEHQYYGKVTVAKYPVIFNNNKSKLFKLFRNYFVGISEQDNDILFDDLQITWTPDTDFYNLVANSCVAFRTLYKLNYDLWKINDLQVKKSSKPTNSNFQSQA